MSARQHARTDRYRAHRTCIAAVDAGFAVQDLRADYPGLDVAEYRFHQIDVVGRRSFRDNLRQYLGASGIDFFRAGLFLPQSIGLAQFAFGQCADAINQHRILLRRRHVPQRLADFVGKFIDDIDHRLHLLVAIDHRAEHHILRQLHRFGFDHQHSQAGPGDDQIELRGLQFGRGRIEDVFTIQISHARRADGAVKGNAGNSERRGRADHGGNVRVHFIVGRHYSRDDLNFVVKTFGEQRPDGAIDQTGGQYFFF